MTWGSFVNYWIMRQMGQEDTICRNYDFLYYAPLHYKPGEHEEVYTLKAAKRMGLSATKPYHVVSEVTARLHSMGFDITDDVGARLVEWYCHDRIRLGEVGNWPRKQPKPAGYLESII